jgi:hypothetical protein
MNAHVIVRSDDALSRTGGERYHMISESEQMKEDEGRASTAPSYVLDPVAFGRRVRALRVIEGYDSVTQLGHAVYLKTGFSMSDRSLYMIERGEQPPSVDAFLALLVTLKPDDGFKYFAPSIRGDIMEQLGKLLAR